MITFTKTKQTINLQGGDDPVIIVKPRAESFSIKSNGLRGPKGEAGERGPAGVAGNIEGDLPDFTLIFENRLI